MGSTGLHETYWKGPIKPTPRWRLWALKVIPYSWFIWWATRGKRVKG